jgi:hypothetical protein
VPPIIYYKQDVSTAVLHHIAPHECNDTHADVMYTYATPSTQTNTQTKLAIIDGPTVTADLNAAAAEMGSSSSSFGSVVSNPESKATVATASPDVATANAAPVATATAAPSRTGMSAGAGAVVGTVIGCLAVVALAAAGAVFMAKRKNERAGPRAKRYSEEYPADAVVSDPGAPVHCNPMQTLSGSQDDSDGPAEL